VRPGLAKREKEGECCDSTHHEIAEANFSHNLFRCRIFYPEDGTRGEGWLDDLPDTGG